MSCNLGTEKMPIILDHQEMDPAPVRQGVFHTIQLQDQEHIIDDTDFADEGTTSKTCKIRHIRLNNSLKTEVGKGYLSMSKLSQGNSKKYPSDEVSPHLLCSSDELINYSNDEHGKEALDEDKVGSRRLKKRGKQKLTSDFPSEVPQRHIIQVQDGSPPEEMFPDKLLKENEVGHRKKMKGKEKLGATKKCYKLMAPHPSACDGQEIGIDRCVEKMTNYHINPGETSGRMMKEIEDEQIKSKDGIHKSMRLSEYPDYGYGEKRTGDVYVQPHFLSDFGNYHKEMKGSDAKMKYFKCFNCSFMTLSVDSFNFHTQKKDRCFSNSETLRCPGCKNVFHSVIPLRFHLIHDHRMSQREVKLMAQTVQDANYEKMDGGREKSSCAFESANEIIPDGSLFAHDLSTAEIAMEAVGGSESVAKSDFVQLPGRNLPRGRELESCANNKRQTMLESYLDDINSKGDCNLPPALTQNGSDLLENTFNFTAPVSEQLPSIQPPPAHSSSNPMLEHGHLMMNQQANHNFVGLGNVFADHRVEESYKPNEGNHYDGDGGLMLTGNYLPHQIHDIPVINLDENHLDKEPENILPQEINMDDFPPYHDNGLSSLDEEDNECRLSPDDEDRHQEEKKKLKKLGVGYRCDINGCKVRLQSEKNIQYHRRCHEGTLYNCPECCKDCSTWVSLSSHLWQAHKIDMELYKCDQCPYKTPSYSRLTNIHRGIHGKARPFLCDVCGKGFKTVKQMRNHKNIHKAKMVRMSVCHCEICGRTVADKRQLELHINNTHKKKKPYLCYMCGYATAVKHSLVVHMRRHTGEKPYECEKCEYKTADHNALRRHKMKHTGVRNYKCNHCNYTCIQASTYKVHIKTKHPGLETDVIFGCGQCNFQTLNRGSFLSHTAEHENYNGQIKKQVKGHSSKPATETGSEYYGETSRIDLVGPIITERVVETIVDLSGAQALLEDDYYERITGDLENGHDLKFKNSAIT